MNKLILKILGYSDQIKKLESKAKELDEIKSRLVEHEFPKELIYTDKSGNKYYQFLEGIAPRTRVQVVQSQQPFLALGFTKEVITEYLSNIDKLLYQIGANQNVLDNAKECGKLNDRLRERINFQIQGEPELKVAMALFLINDEPDQFSEYHAELKRQIWAKDPEALSFFLCKVLMFEDESLKISPEAVAEYLIRKGLYKEMMKNTIGDHSQI